MPALDLGPPMKRLPAFVNIRAFRAAWVELDLGATVAGVMDQYFGWVDELRANDVLGDNNDANGPFPSYNYIRYEYSPHEIRTALVVDLRTNHVDAITAALGAKRDDLLGQAADLAPTVDDINDGNEADLAAIEATYETLVTCASNARKLEVSTAVVRWRSQINQRDWDRATPAFRIVSVVEGIA